MKDQCPVNECKEVKNLRESLKWWAGTIIIIVLAVSAPALYAWSRSLLVPEIKQDVKAQAESLIRLQEQQAQILKNTEDIKTWIKDKQCPL